jgi:hypothetical protein
MLLGRGYCITRQPEVEGKSEDSFIIFSFHGIFNDLWSVVALFFTFANPLWDKKLSLLLIN